MLAGEMGVRVLLLGLLCGLSSCRYMGDRGLDFLDQFRVSAGVVSGAGVRARALGVVDTGLMIGVKPNAAALGWRYGRPLFFNQADGTVDADQAEIWRATSITKLDYGKGTYDSARSSIALLPAVFTWTDATPKRYEWLVPEEAEDYRDRSWLWAKDAVHDSKYARIHAFDVEAEVGLGVYVEAGYSPGELLDFLLGIIGIDIAGDDGRLGSGK